MKKFLLQTVAVAALLLPSVAHSQSSEPLVPGYTNGVAAFNYLWDTATSGWYRNRGSLGQLVIGHNIFTKSGTVTEPATTVSHAPGSDICASAVQCSGMYYSIGRGSGYGIRVTKVKVSTTTLTGMTNAYPRVYFFGTGNPTLTSIIDGSTYGPYYADNLNGLLAGWVDCPTQNVFLDNITWDCQFPPGTDPVINTALSGSQLTLVLAQSPLASGSFTNAASQVWEISVTAELQ